jgi:plastocyanin
MWSAIGQSRARRPIRYPFLRCTLVLLCALAACGEQGEKGAAAVPEPADTSLLARLDSGEGVHLVRLVARGAEYAFEPREIRARPGDIVRFVHTGYQPESVAFDPEETPPGGDEFLHQAEIVRGPLLTRPGQVYDISLEGAVPGRYGFYSVPHEAYGMRGVLIVAGNS